MMRITVTLEHRFERTPDGAVWTPTGATYSFFTRYLEVFDQVNVVARVKDTESVPSSWKRADGERVVFSVLPYYIGPMQYLLTLRQLRNAARQAVLVDDAVIFRVASQIASVIEPEVRRVSHPYGIEVVGDPFDVFAPGASTHPLRRLFRWYFPRKLREQCANSASATYVTKYALQRRYPPSSSAFSTYYSDVELPESAFAGAPRVFDSDSRQYSLIMVGGLGHLYKAPDVLIDAAQGAVEKGIDLKLTFIGDGKHRGELEQRAIAHGIGERVIFRGELPAGPAVIAELDSADLFVLPSYQEGLPRAMVEAMARGLPCIGSTVGGIPELLETDEMVPPGNAEALTEKIVEVVSDPARMTAMSERNLSKSQEYREQFLHDRRLEFYQTVRAQMEKWLEQGNDVHREQRSEQMNV